MAHVGRGKMRRGASGRWRLVGSNITRSVGDPYMTSD